MDGHICDSPPQVECHIALHLTWDLLTDGWFIRDSYLTDKWPPTYFRTPLCCSFVSFSGSLPLEILPAFPHLPSLAISVALRFGFRILAQIVWFSLRWQQLGFLRLLPYDFLCLLLSQPVLLWLIWFDSEATVLIWLWCMLCCIAPLPGWDCLTAHWFWKCIFCLRNRSDVLNRLTGILCSLLWPYLFRSGLWMTSLMPIEFSTGPRLTTRGHDLLLSRTVRFRLVHVVPHHISAVTFTFTTDAVRPLGTWSPVVLNGGTCICWQLHLAGSDKHSTDRAALASNFASIVAYRGWSRPSMFERGDRRRTFHMLQALCCLTVWIKTAVRFFFSLVAIAFVVAISMRAQHWGHFLSVTFASYVWTLIPRLEPVDVE